MIQPEISVVICTYNRSALLRGTLQSVFNQDTEIPFEVIVVDNNSSDDTKQVVESFTNLGYERLRYVFEARQGNAYARNTGIVQARAAIIAFVDDDILVDRKWLKTIKLTLNDNPAVTFIGGKVLPDWASEPPAWLTNKHWAPIAAVDYGEKPLLIGRQNPLCLLTANIAFRRQAFEQTDPFLPTLQRVKGAIGSMEDHELILRLVRRGQQGLYVPELIATTHVPEQRMTKEYHRRWHRGHGRFYAIMQDQEWEQSRHQILGLPAHVCKQTLAEALQWLKHILLGDQNEAFVHERQLRFFSGFFLQRQKQLFEGSYRKPPKP